MRQLPVGAGRALVPFFWHIELANGLLVAERRKLISGDDADRFVSEIEYLLLSVIETRGDVVPLRDAIAASPSCRIAPYDAIYLDLARREGIPLATLDQKLQLAAVSAGVSVIR
ncbi:MAG TPA: type II toxin-antitoxin system VapC family toxin [Candidatus Acidoferrales bacterium]|nr:type II toxin-antitoxin system VapC family toxin [Candidatus Acidoferrales bacterium]